MSCDTLDTHIWMMHLLLLLLHLLAPPCTSYNVILTENRRLNYITFSKKIQHYYQKLFSILESRTFAPLYQNTLNPGILTPDTFETWYIWHQRNSKVICLKYQWYLTPWEFDTNIFLTLVEFWHLPSLVVHICHHDFWIMEFWHSRNSYLRYLQILVLSDDSGIWH